MQKIRNRIAQIVGCFVKDFECIENVYDVSLMELGLDKATFIQVLYIIEEQFDIEIPCEYMQGNGIDTINALVEGVCGIL